MSKKCLEEIITSNVHSEAVLDTELKPGQMQKKAVRR
jgi:hypothetical protein